jgi:hypothetical protein
MQIQKKIQCDKLLQIAIIRIMCWRVLEEDQNITPNPFFFPIISYLYVKMRLSKELVDKIMGRG